MGHHRGGEGLAILEHLDLSQAQKDAVIGILNAAKPNLKAIHEDMMKSAMALHELTPDDPKYAAAVTQAAQEEGNLVTKLVQQRASLMADIYKQLTPDQKAKLQKIKAEMKWRHAIGDEMDGGMMDGKMGGHEPKGHPEQ